MFSTFPCLSKYLYLSSFSSVSSLLIILGSGLMSLTHLWTPPGFKLDICPKVVYYKELLTVVLLPPPVLYDLKGEYLFSEADLTPLLLMPWVFVAMEEEPLTYC